MFDAKSLLEILALPIGVSIVVATVIALIARKSRQRERIHRFSALMIPAAYGSAHAVHFPRPDWISIQNVDAWQWTLPVTALAAVIAIMDVGMDRSWLRRLLRLVLIAAAALATLQSYLRFTWSPAQSALWIGAIAAGGVLWWALVESDGGREGNWFALQWLLVTVGSGALFVLSGSQRLLEMTLMVGAGVGVAWVLQLIGLRSMAIGLFATTPVILIVLWMNAYFYADAAAWRVLLPAAAPLAAWSAQAPLFRRWSPRVRGFAATVATAALLAGAIVPAVMHYNPNPYGGY